MCTVPSRREGASTVTELIGVRERASGAVDEDALVSRWFSLHGPPGILMAAALMLGTACGDENRTEATSDEIHLMLLDEPTWKLTEAVDYRAGLGALEDQDPDLDWFAEYDGSRVDNPDGSYTIPHVATFGHTAGLERRRGQLPGIELRSEVVDGNDALVSVAVDGDPAIAIIEVMPGYTTTLVTYDADVTIDLADLASHLVAVDEEQWAAAGGSLLDCVPLEPGCRGES
jgi:hypothetical protein